LLLALPDPCLLAVLQCCACDQRSLFSAARAHSRLHQAVPAQRSVTAVVRRQQHVDSVLLYLEKHSLHVSTLDLKGEDSSRIVFRQLPLQLQLTSLQLGCLGLQLQPGNGFQDVLGAAGLAALKQLRLKDCKLLDDTSGKQLTAAMSLLPAGLEHLSIDGFNSSAWFPTAVLQQLQQLTYLGLRCVYIVPPEDDGSNPLQPMQALSRLRDLRLLGLANSFKPRITASMLSGMPHLTRLVFGQMEVDPGAFAGKSQLQHLAAKWCSVNAGATCAPADRAPGVAQLLSHLQQLTQLTYLGLTNSLGAGEDYPLTAAAYSSLTASSKLQYLDIGACRLPTGIWEHMVPAGRKLQQMQYLRMSIICRWSNGPAAPEGEWLVGCCPSLQSLDMRAVQCNAELLAALQGLSELHTLGLTLADSTAVADVQRVCQLTGLRELNLQAALGNCWDRDTEGWLMQVTQLKQLTTLTYEGPIFGTFKRATFSSEVSLRARGLNLALVLG
jgi:hypothetical protein